MMHAFSKLILFIDILSAFVVHFIGSLGRFIISIGLPRFCISFVWVKNISRFSLFVMRTTAIELFDFMPFMYP